MKDSLAAAFFLGLAASITVQKGVVLPADVPVWNKMEELRLEGRSRGW